MSTTTVMMNGDQYYFSSTLPIQYAAEITSTFIICAVSDVSHRH